MEDVAKDGGKCDRCCGDSRFVDGRDLANINKRLAVKAREMEVVLKACFENWSEAFDTLVSKPLSQFIDCDRNGLRGGREGLINRSDLRRRANRRCWESGGVWGNEMWSRWIVVGCVSDGASGWWWVREGEGMT